MPSLKSIAVPNGAENVTWATGLTAAGRPIVVPNMEPTLEGKRVCPSLDGASNWYSTSFNPATELYYVQTNDKCGIFTREPMEWEAGKGFMGGSFAPAPDLRSVCCARSTSRPAKRSGRCRRREPSTHGAAC